MSSSSVWVQVYYKGKVEPVGQPTSVKKPKDVEESEWNVDALAAVVLPKLDPTELAEIFVYPPGITPPFSQDKALNSWDPIPPNSSGPQPLIVVAPPPQQDGEIILNFFMVYN